MPSSHTTTTTSPSHTRSPLHTLIAGGLSGMVAKTVVAPLDRIKILYQVSDKRFQLRNVPTMVRTIVRTEGLGGLWKGNFVMMIRVFPYAGVQFMVFDHMKSYFTSQSGGMTPTRSLISGSAAGLTSTVFTYPLDLARARLAVSRCNGVGGFRNVLTELYKDGFTSMYRGIIPTVVGMVPYAGLAFTTNDILRNAVLTRFHKGESGEEGGLGVYEKLVCGGVSGLFAQSAVYPLDVTRRRMQTVGVVSQTAQVPGIGISSTVSGVGGRVTMWSTLRGIHGEGGIRALFKGLTMNWIKGPVAFSISFTCFDYFKEIIENGGVVKGSGGGEGGGRVIRRRGTGDRLDATRGEVDETQVAVVFKEDQEDEEEGRGG